MGVARSGIGWLVAKYGTLILSFLAVMIFTRVLPNPTETLGLFQLFETILSLIMLTTSAGLGTAVVKRVSEGNEPGAIASAVFRISVVVLVILTFALTALSGPITDYFGYGLGFLSLFIVTIWGKQIWKISADILQGHSLVGRSGGVEFVEMFVKVVVQITLVFLGFELLGLVGGAAVGTVIAAIVAFAMIPKGFTKPSREHYQRLFSFTKFSFFRGFAGKVYNNIDVLVIAWLIGNSAVALYAIPYRLTLALDAFVGSIRSSILPAISKSAEENDTERIHQLLEDAFVFSTIFAIPAAVGVAILSKPLIVTLFTAELAGGASIAVFAMVIQIPQSVRAVSMSALDGVDRPDIALRGDIVLIVLNVLLDVALVPLLGIEGAAVATLVATTVSAGYYLYSAVRILDISWYFLPLRPLTEQVLSATVMGVVVHLTFVGLPLPQLWALAVVVPLGIIVYAVLLLLISPSTRRRMQGILRDIVPM